MIDQSVEDQAKALAEALKDEGAIRHFTRFMDPVTLTKGPWAGLTRDEIRADVQTANWAPNRAMWRAQGFRNYAHAQAVLGG